MRLAYFDCLEGASGSLFLSSLVDAGAEIKAVERGLQGTALGAVRLKAAPRKAGSLRALEVLVQARSGPSRRSLKEVLSIVDEARLPGPVRTRALAVYGLLGKAEARAHGACLDEVHFHELGRARSIAGVLGTLLALHQLKVGRVFLSRLALGEGRIKTAHGEIPSPAPAALELMKGLPLKGGARAAEPVTPTGAALIRALASRWGPPPRMTFEASGYGGDSSGERFVRVLVGRMG
ncbi:MAG: LarC family nickel insertion protein [Elusimicrobia bacterium]|nr:LarC family nickel insertion protein [Elusimicrobiota bacterium]